MPGQDRTGPMGRGPMTGRGLGPCGGASEAVPYPGMMRGRGLGRGGRGMGRGRGFGMGRGQGYGYGYGRDADFVPTRQQYQNIAPPVLSSDEELQFLQERLDFLKKDSDAISKRIEELKTSQDS